MIYNFDSIQKTSADDILSIISEEEIYSYYMSQDFRINKLYQCEFHKDKTPSLGFYQSKKYIRYKCFGCGSTGNPFEFVMNLFEINFYEALEKIISDFNIIQNETNTKVRREIKRSFTNNISEVKIYPSFQPFNKVDFDYWSQYSLDLSFILNYNVNSCETVYFTSRSGKYRQYGIYSKENPMYCYSFNNSYKIYRPLSDNKQGKWLQNSTSWDIQGMEQLPKKADIIIITSSLKDVMVLRKLGYYAIAPHGESVMIPDKIIDYIYGISDNVIVFYDQDEAGIKYSNILSDKLSTSRIFIPKEYNIKDISDYVKNTDINEGKLLMNKLI